MIAFRYVYSVNAFIQPARKSYRWQFFTFMQNVIFLEFGRSDEVFPKTIYQLPIRSWSALGTCSRQLISERKHALGRKKLRLRFKHLRQSKKLEARKQKHFKVIIKSITRSFIMLNTIKENENTSFANISIPFLRSGCQERDLYCEHDLCCEHHLRKGMEISAKLVFSFSFIVFNIIKLLVMLFIMKFIAQINIFK